MSLNRVRFAFLMALLALTCRCVVDAPDEPPEQTVQAAEALQRTGPAPLPAEVGPLPPGPPSSLTTEPVVLKETRTAWDELIREKLPKWEVYTLPQGLQRDAPILAVPKDGRGVPLILWFGHYHYGGDAYFTQMLTSGFISLLDLQVIMHELKKYPAGRPPLMKEVPHDAVDPFTQALTFPRSGRQEGDGPVSSPGDGDDHAGQGGPPTVVTTPSPTVTGAPVYHCGGKRVSSSKDCPDYDERVSGGQKLAQAEASWCSANGEAAAKAVEETPLVPTMAALCSDPAARSAGAGGAPCALVPHVEDMRHGDTIGSFFKRHFFGDGKGPACADACASVGAGGAGLLTGGVILGCVVLTDGLGGSVCLGAPSVVAAIAGGTVASSGALGVVLNRACVNRLCVGG